MKRIGYLQKNTPSKLSPIDSQMHRLIKASHPTCSSHLLLANGELFFFLPCPYRQGSGTLSVAVGFGAAPLIGPLWTRSDWD